MGGVQGTPAFRSVAPDPEFSRRTKGSGGGRRGESVLPIHLHERDLGLVASRHAAGWVEEDEGPEAREPPSRRAWASSGHLHGGADDGRAGGHQIVYGGVVPPGGGRRQHEPPWQLQTGGGAGVGIRMSDWDDDNDDDVVDYGGDDGHGDDRCGMEAGAGHRGHAGVGKPRDFGDAGGVHGRGRGGGVGGGWLYQGDLDDVDEYEDEDNSFRGESLILQLRQLSSQVEIDHRGGATASQRWPLGRDNDNDNDDNGTKVRRSASLEGEVVGVRRHSRSGLSTRGVGKALSVADMLRQELADSEERTRYHDNLSMAPTRPSSSMLGGGVIAASSRAAQLGAAKRHAHPVPPPAPAASRLAAKGRPTRHR